MDTSMHQLCPTHATRGKVFRCGKRKFGQKRNISILKAYKLSTLLRLTFI
jgi:hypothetical protein